MVVRFVRFLKNYFLPFVPEPPTRSSLLTGVSTSVMDASMKKCCGKETRGNGNSRSDMMQQ